MKFIKGKCTYVSISLFWVFNLTFKCIPSRMSYIVLCSLLHSFLYSVHIIKLLKCDRLYTRLWKWRLNRPQYLLRVPIFQRGKDRHVNKHVKPVTNPFIKVQLGNQGKERSFPLGWGGRGSKRTSKRSWALSWALKMINVHHMDYRRKGVLSRQSIDKWRCREVKPCNVFRRRK